MEIAVPFQLIIGVFKCALYFLLSEFYGPRQMRDQAFGGKDFQRAPKEIRNAVIEVPVYQSRIKILTDNYVPTKWFEIVIWIADTVFVKENNGSFPS